MRGLRANQPKEYVGAIRQLFENNQIREEIYYNARKLVETEFTWESAGRRYEQVCVGS